MIDKKYTAQATATGGRNGNVKSSDGVVDIEVRMPKEMGGPGGAYSNPEQLFAAGYAVCFDNALNLVIRMAKIKTDTTTVKADVGIGDNGKGGFGLVIELEVIIPRISQEEAESLVAKAHEVCPYSNAIRGNVEVTINVFTEKQLA